MAALTACLLAASLGEDACTSAECLQREVVRLRQELAVLRSELADRAAGCTNDAGDLTRASYHRTLLQPVQKEVMRLNHSGSTADTTNAPEWNSLEAEESRRLQDSRPHRARRPVKRYSGGGGLYKKVAGFVNGGWSSEPFLHSTVGNCSFYRHTETNLFEMIQVPIGTLVGNAKLHGGRCSLRHTDLRSALDACAATSTCAGVSKDNGLVCGSGGGQPLSKHELRAGAPMPNEATVSWVCKERQRTVRSAPA